MRLDAYTDTETNVRTLPLSAAMPDEHSWAAQPDAYDLAAEREANALAFLDEELEVHADVPAFEQRLAEPVIRDYRYNRVASYKAHERIERHYKARLAGHRSTYTFDREICTRADRARRKLRKERRKLLLDPRRGSAMNTFHWQLPCAC
jgi:hypothetical protein